MLSPPLLFLVVSFCLWQSVTSFQPNCLTRRSTTALRSTVNREGTSEAISGLEAVLEEQKKKVQETETLIEALRTASNGNLTSQTADILSQATNLLSGVDYGFRGRSDGPLCVNDGNISVLEGLAYGGPPANLWTIGTTQFRRNFDAIRGEYRDEEDLLLTPKQKELQDKLDELTLDPSEIWDRELSDGPLEAPWVIKVPYFVVCYMLDALFGDKMVFSRFFLLETVARMPYFSYITMLHLYETLGFWRRSADMKRVHFAEELNEFRHLLIMESLGGDQRWVVRFLAQHSAILYYFVLCILWAASPSLSYKFSEMLETHAVNTYTVFLDENEEKLKRLPPSVVAAEYYAFTSSDSFYAEFQTTALTEGRDIRRPASTIRSLYDVFSAIRDDEKDHAGTMTSFLDSNAVVRSVATERGLAIAVALAASSTLLSLTGGNPGLSEGPDFAVDATNAMDVGVADVAVAGIGGVIQGVMESLEEGELTSLEILQEGPVEIMRFAARFIKFL